MSKQQHHWAKKKKIEKHQKEQYNFLKTTFFVFLIMFLMIVFYVLIFSSVLKIANIRVIGLSGLGNSEIQRSVEEYLSTRSFFVFPRNNLLVFQKKAVEDQLKEDFKKIRHVSVSKIFPDSVKIEISERDLLLLLCSRDECFMIDEEGRAYKKADFESKNIKENDLIQVFDLSEKEISEGSYVLKKEYCDFVMSIKEELHKKMGIVISQKYETSSRIADEVIVKTSEGWKIYFDSQAPIDESLRFFETFFEKEIDQEKRSNLEYVDLRARSKIFYKLVGEDGQDSEQQQVVDGEVSEQEVVSIEAVKQEAVIVEQETKVSDKKKKETNIPKEKESSE
ncbi:MAG: FtsQ-type POTRA domain-containing protein [Candidatus Moranbacteria bacterium]|nr:FtsQ-type POTRA domain-containing protein [Candidatus Moranbacteria bacterium]